MLAGAQPSPLLSPAVFLLAGTPLTLEAADPLLVEAVASVLGAAALSRAPGPGLRAAVEGPGLDGCGRILLAADDGRSLADADADLRLGLDSPGFPFEERPPEAPGALTLAFRGAADAVLTCRGGEVHFRAVAGWRRAVAFLLLHRLVGLRADALFFHAASVGVAGRGALLVGPKGAGKSTLALGLAARGHDFLGDETACYLPAAGTIIPLRRPVGIKPGPRARAIDEALARARLQADADGIVRMDVEALLEPEARLAAPRALPLRAVLFLEGFGPAPRVTAAAAERDAVARLQPFSSSLTAAPQAQRVFEMARLLGAARVFRVTHGDPDGTTDAVAEALGAAWD
ncbi:MAG TPA: hypothetical protein VF310_05700 [Vicinamibacteria bacterium]